MPSKLISNSYLAWGPTMRRLVRRFALVTLLLPFMLRCVDNKSNNAAEFAPSQIIDLGTMVTEDLPERVWGKGFLKQMGFTRQNSFEVVSWGFPVKGDTVQGSNSYYTLFNHGGPHVDAPSHVGLPGGLDSYPVEKFSGRVKVFDVSSYSSGRSVSDEVFRGKVSPGDVVIIFTGYSPPQKEGALPEVRTLTHEAAEFLAGLPVGAYGTDAFSVEALDDTKMPWIHHSFLSRGIPVYEQLFNVDLLLTKTRMYFVGVPLKIKDGDGMMVRPIVFIY